MRFFKSKLQVVLSSAVTILTVVAMAGATTIGTNISTDGTLSVAGNTGIGTTTPNSLLDVYATDGGSNLLNLETSTGSKVTVLNSGNVGIGTTSPSVKLSIEDNTLKSIHLKRTGVTESWSIGVNTLAEASTYGGTYPMGGMLNFFNDIATDTIPFRMDYTPYGDGASDDIEGARFIVTGKTVGTYAASVISLAAKDSAVDWQLVHRGSLSQLDSFHISAWVGSWITPFTITPTGYVGVNTATPGSSLQVSGGAAIGYSAATAAPNNGLIISGNVGIATTTPAATLDINGYMRLKKNLSQPVACSGGNDGAMALNSIYAICVCNGSGWINATSTEACVW